MRVFYLFYYKSTKAVSYKDQRPQSTAHLFQINMKQTAEVFPLLTFVGLRIAAIWVLNSVARASIP